MSFLREELETQYVLTGKLKKDKMDFYWRGLGLKESGNLDENSFSLCEGNSIRILSIHGVMDFFLKNKQRVDLLSMKGKSGYEIILNDKIVDLLIPQDCFELDLKKLNMRLNFTKQYRHNYIDVSPSSSLRVIFHNIQFPLSKMKQASLELRFNVILRRPID